MKLIQIRHFVGLADELHFGRAAARLGIAQPPFSQSIRRLEARLGFELVDRSGPRVALTPAGEAFAREARIALRQIDLVERVARRAAHGEISGLRVGFVEPALFRILPRILPDLRATAGEGGLALIEKRSPDQADAIVQGELDIGFLLPRPDPFEGVETAVIESSRLLVCIAAHSPLAARKRLHLADLADEPFILIPREIEPANHDGILSACRRAGFTPRVDRQSLNSLSMTSLVAMGLGIAFLPESARGHSFDGVCFRDVEGLPDLRRDLLLAWRREDPSPRLPRLIETIRRKCAEPAPD